jgi:hypothetical protein
MVYVASARKVELTSVSSERRFSDQFDPADPVLAAVRGDAGLAVAWRDQKIAARSSQHWGAPGCHEFGGEDVGGCAPADDLAGPMIAAVLDAMMILDGVGAQVGLLREGLATQSVGVLVRSAQPGAWRAG